MAKGAATEQALGAVHSMLAKVFTRSLERQLKIYEALDRIPDGEIEADMLETLVDMQEPNPALLSAMSKFLKDNDIGVDAGEIETLNATERRLEEQRKKRREAGVNLNVIPIRAEYGT